MTTNTCRTLSNLTKFLDRCHSISKTHKILDLVLCYLMALERLFKYHQARLVVIGKICQILSLIRLEYILRPLEYILRRLVSF